MKSPTGEELFGEIEDSDNADDSDAYAPDKSGSEDGVSVSSLDINNNCWSLTYFHRMMRMERRRMGGSQTRYHWW